MIINTIEDARNSRNDGRPESIGKLMEDDPEMTLDEAVNSLVDLGYNGPCVKMFMEKVGKFSESTPEVVMYVLLGRCRWLSPSKHGWVHPDGRVIFVDWAQHELYLEEFGTNDEEMYQSGWARVGMRIQTKYRLTPRQRTTIKKMGLVDLPLHGSDLTARRPPLKDVVELGMGVRTWPTREETNKRRKKKGLGHGC